jgi:hypothetical protein
MPTVYVLSLDRERSGDLKTKEDGSNSIPSPALVRVSRQGDSLRYELLVELIGEAWPVVTELTVRAAGGESRSITASALRDIRFGQLLKACASFLRRSAAAGVWPDSETFTIYEAGDLQRLDEMREEQLEEHWRSFLPPMLLEDREGAQWLTRPDPEWLERVKDGGARSEQALRATAAIYRRAVERGRPGNADVERFLDLPKSTASEWVAKARARGYLERSPRKPRADRKDDA